MITVRSLAWLAAGVIGASVTYVIARSSHGRGYATGYVEATSGHLRRIAAVHPCTHSACQDRRS